MTYPRNDADTAAESEIAVTTENQVSQRSQSTTPWTNPYSLVVNSLIAEKESLKSQLEAGRLSSQIRESSLVETIQKLESRVRSLERTLEKTNASLHKIRKDALALVQDCKERLNEYDRNGPDVEFYFLLEDPTQASGFIEGQSGNSVSRS